MDYEAGLSHTHEKVRFISNGMEPYPKMKVTAKRNFLANGIPGHPGKVLSFEEMQAIQNILVNMQVNGLVDVELEPVIEVSEVVVEAEVEKPKKPKAKKKVTE